MRFVPQTDDDRREMLREVGVKSVDELFASIPGEALPEKPPQLPEPVSESEITQELGELASVNTSLEESVSFLGAGCYDHYVPAVVDEIFSRGELFSPYTPYQPEVSQGTLQLLFEYQSMLCELFSMDVSNASMYEGASALAEALLMSGRIRRGSRVLLSSAIHPEYRRVVRTYFSNSETSVEEVPYKDGCTSVEKLKELLDGNVSAVAVSSPNFFGCVEEMEELSRVVRSSGALFVAIVDPISLAILSAPGEYDADIAVAEGQCLGNYPALGGGGFGILATRREFIRQLPGRIVGETTDAEGRRGFVLTLQTREQHIRRERATSNICTNSTLTALRAGAYLSALGYGGLRRVAELCLLKAHFACERICEQTGYERAFSAPFFKEFVIRCPYDVDEIRERLLNRGIHAGVNIGKFYPELGDCLLIAVTEKRTRWEIEQLVEALGTITV